MKKKTTISLTDEEKKSLEKQKMATYVKKISTNNYDDDNNYEKVKNHCNYTGKLREAAHKYLQFKMQNTKKTPIVFHNGSAYDYHFIINQLAK